ncbi:MAG: hypothetical protein LAT55_13475 [Opitutales bacterium]|nr:hypothetical protein [Opitutales bacterium]
MAVLPQEEAEVGGQKSEGVYLPRESAENPETSEDLPRRWMRLKVRQVVSAKDRAMNQPDYANSHSKSYDFLLRQGYGGRVGYNSQLGETTTQRDTPSPSAPPRLALRFSHPSSTAAGSQSVVPPQEPNCWRSQSRRSAMSEANRVFIPLLA